MMMKMMKIGVKKNLDVCLLRVGRSATFFFSKGTFDT